MTSDQLKDVLVWKVMTACAEWLTDEHRSMLDGALRLALFHMNPSEEETALSTEVRTPNAPYVANAFWTGSEIRFRWKEVPQMCSVMVVVAVSGWFAAGMLWCCLKAGKDEEDDHEGVIVSREAKR